MSQITPLKYFRAWHGNADMGAVYGVQRYSTADGRFTIEGDSGQWRVSIPLHQRLQHPTCFEAFIASGLRDVRFDRRRDAVEAIEQFNQLFLPAFVSEGE